MPSIVTPAECRKINVKEEIVKLEYAEPIMEYKQYSFEINDEIVLLSRKELYNLIYDYIKENVSPSKNNEKYISKLTNSYIRLFDKCKNNDRVLMYIALCKIESNFNNESISKCNAYGIPQVMLSVWHNVMKNNWGVSIEQYKKDLYLQLYVGWKIYNNYYKKNNGNIIKTHQGYNGSNGNSYHKKIMKEHKILISKVK